MKLEDILSEWAKDSKIDNTELDKESLKIPALHNKYLTSVIGTIPSLFHSAKSFLSFVQSFSLVLNPKGVEEGRLLPSIWARNT